MLMILLRFHKNYFSPWIQEGSPVISPKKLSHSLVEKKEAIVAHPSRQGVNAGNEVFKGDQVLGWASP